MSEPACNLTCCQYEDGKEFCFDQYNFTDFNEIKVYPVWEVAIRWIITLPIVVVGFFGNLTVIVILLKNRILLRTDINIFILNMAVSDLILAIAGPIPFTIRCTHQFWVLGKVWCHLDGFVQVTVMQVSVISLSIISVDRLLGILSPSYSHLKKWQAILYIAGVWIFSCLLGVPFYIYRNFGIHAWADVTEIYCDEYLTKTRFYWLIIIVILNWIPLIIMTTCYLHLFIFFKKHSFTNNSNSELFSSFIKGNDATTKNKQKLLKMLFAMILAFVACWLPLQAFIIYREIIIFSEDGQVSTPKTYNSLLDLTQYIVYMYPVVNPFIYSLMHQNFKNGFRVTFPCFFKEEADFVLQPGQGTRPYVWSRTSVRHTIHATSYEALRRARMRTKNSNTVLRTFSLEEEQRSSHSSIPKKVEENIDSISKSKHLLTLVRSSSDVSDRIQASRRNSSCQNPLSTELQELNATDLLDKLISKNNSKLNHSKEVIKNPKIEDDESLTKEGVFKALRNQGHTKLRFNLENNKNLDSSKISSNPHGNANQNIPQFQNYLKNKNYKNVQNIMSIRKAPENEIQLKSAAATDAKKKYTHILRVNSFESGFKDKQNKLGAFMYRHRCKSEGCNS